MLFLAFFIDISSKNQSSSSVNWTLFVIMAPSNFASPYAISLLRHHILDAASASSSLVLARLRPYCNQHRMNAWGHYHPRRQYPVCLWARGAWARGPRSPVRSFAESHFSYQSLNWFRGKYSRPCFCCCLKGTSWVFCSAEIIMIFHVVKMC